MGVTCLVLRSRLGSLCGVDEVLLRSPVTLTGGDDEATGGEENDDGDLEPSMLMTFLTNSSSAGLRSRDFVASERSSADTAHEQHTTKTDKLTNTRDAQASLGYLDRCIRCDDCPSTSVIRDADAKKQDQGGRFLSRDKMSPPHLDV